VRRIASVLLLLVFGTLGLAIATQYVAAALHNPAELGAPCLGAGESAVYAPWAWIRGSESLGLRAPEVVRNAGAISAAAAVVALLAILVVNARGSSGKRSTAHGSSRWATTREIETAGLLREDGVVLCQTSDAVYTTRIDADGKTQIALRRAGRLVRHYGPEHLLAFAPTRSGKGVGLVVPTLHTWPHSVLVYDIKKENWALTAGWRRQFSHVWRFEPTSPDSLHFNPLLEIRKGLSEVKDTQNVADILVDPTGDKETKDHWQTTAHSLLVGAILHVLYAEPDKTLTGVATFLSDPGRQQMATLQRMLETQHLPTGPHAVVAQAAREMLNKSENELSGVFSTAMSCLGLYRDPLIARSTSSSDFRIADLMNAERPVSLYLVVPPSDLSRTVVGRPLLAKPLTAAAKAWERKFYGLSRGRVVSAVMHPFVLVPEGRLDTDWLARIASLGDCEQTQVPPFACVYGLAPTEDARVAETVERMGQLRDRIVALVDGDKAGDDYAKELLSLTPPPSAIIQWPPNWTIENVVRWIMEPGGASLLTTLQGELPHVTFPSLDVLLDLLRTENDQKKRTTGLKQDHVSHEAIVAVLEHEAAVRARAAEVCEALVRVALGSIAGCARVAQVNVPGTLPPHYRFVP